MSHRRKKFLSAGLAGVLCSTALFGLTAAYADGKNNLHLPGMRDRHHSPDNSFTRMFPELPPFAPPTDAAREQAKKLGEKGGLIDALDNQGDRRLRSLRVQSEQSRQSQHDGRLHLLRPVSGPRCDARPEIPIA